MAVLSTACRFALLATALSVGLGAAGAKSLTAKDRVAIEAAFAKADVNGDGWLTREEAAALPDLVARFAALDRNKDGLLNLEEFSASMTA